MWRRENAGGLVGSNSDVEAGRAYWSGMDDPRTCHRQGASDDSKHNLRRSYDVDPGMKIYAWS
jgi:hypothetical protein